MRVLTPQGLCELTDAEDGDDDDDDAQQSREEEHPCATLRAGLGDAGLGDWGRPARRHPLLGLRGRVRARMIVIAHVSFLPQGNGGVVTGSNIRKTPRPTPRKRSRSFRCPCRRRLTRFSPGQPRPRHEEAGTKAVIPVVLMPISMSSKTHMVCFGRLRRFDV